MRNSQLAEQLAPLAKKMKEKRATIRVVSQLNVRLSHNSEDRFDGAVREVLRWMDERSGKQLPPDAWQLQSFDLTDIGAQRTSAIALQTPKYWAARMDNPDSSIPRRTWVTEIGIAETDGGTLFGTRLLCATQGEDVPFERSIPGFAQRILKSGPFELDGVAIPPAIPVISDLAKTTEFVRLLENPNRQADVVVFTLPANSVDSSETVIPVNEIYNDLRGIAHFYILTGQASYRLTDMVGKEFSVFRQAVRIYRPGFSRTKSDPFDHQLFLPERIYTWNDKNEESFNDWLSNQLLSASVHVTDRETLLPSFNFVRRLADEESRNELVRAGGDAKELNMLFQEENERLRKDILDQEDEFNGLLKDAEEERDAAKRENDELKQQLAQYKIHIHHLRNEIRLAGNKNETVIPDSFEDFEKWCELHLTGSVVVLKRAYQAVKKSVFHDPSFVYKALLLLRDYYVPMRAQSSASNLSAYEDALKQLNLLESRTGKGVNFFEDLYTVQYMGKKRELDRHLKGSSSRSRERGFRLYFFWDEENSVAVVGSLPEHLDNRAT